MARYFAGNTLASFFRSAPSVVESTTAGRFDAAFVSSAISFPTGDLINYIETMPFIDAATTNSLWVHFDYHTSGISSAGLFFRVFNASGQQMFAVEGASGGMNPVYWNGSTDTAGAIFPVSVSQVVRWDISIQCGTPGSYAIYNQGTLVSSGSMHVATTALAMCRFNNVGSASNGYISQIMGCDFDTRDSRYFQAPLAALGTRTQGTGAVTAINEVVLDESTSVSHTTSGHERSFTHPALSLPAGYQIGAICAGARGRVNGSAPNGKLGIYDITAAASYLSGSLAYNTGYEPRGAIWATNPNTAADWTQADYNDAEIILAGA